MKYISINEKDYIQILKQGDKNNLRHILEVSKDVRKFEIELYWKRAAYFWAFVSVFFIGFYQTLPEPKFDGNFLQERLINKLCYNSRRIYIFSRMVFCQ